MSQHQQNPSTRKNSAKIDQSLKKTDPKKFIKANLFIKDKVIKKQMQKNFDRTPSFDQVNLLSLNKFDQIFQLNR